MNKTFTLVPQDSFSHPNTIVVGYYGITLVVRVSICPSVVPPSVFSFPDDNLSKCQWIITKLGMCIGIVEI